MIITRFAPSPTGYLHIGGLRTALYSYLWAKKNKGKFLLRIEDTDKKRNSQQATKQILEVFKWVNIDIDDEIVYQSKRDDIYKKYINILLEQNLAYYCYMSKEDLDKLRAEQKSNKQTTRYDNRYRNFKGDIPKNIKPVVRLKVPQNTKICFKDGIKGNMEFNTNDIDDFIIARSDSSPTYNFVVAIDDALMGVNEIIRGDDHLTNTPKQIIIYNALNFDIPKFYHISMINNEKGQKLSKRDGALDVLEYKKMGYLNYALLNFLIRLGWGHKDDEIFSINDMLKLFNPNDINKSASSYNVSKLEWINSYYIANTSNKELINILNIDYNCDFKQDCENTKQIVNLFKTRAKNMIELKKQIAQLKNKPQKYETHKFLTADNVVLSKKYMLELKEFDFVSKNELEKLTKEFLKTNNTKPPYLFMPLRIALVGVINAPSVYELLMVLGKNESLKRINVALNISFNL
jgi:glutamyl-tRNA synthetase